MYYVLNIIKNTFRAIFGRIFWEIPFFILLNYNPDFDVRAGHDRLRLRITQPGCEAGAAVDHWRITRCTHEPKRARRIFASDSEVEGSGEEIQ